MSTVAVVMPDPIKQFFDANGVPVANGFLYAYVAGSVNTPQTTYADSDLTTPNTNPLQLDASGFATVFLKPAFYKFVLTDADDVQIWSQDNIAGSVWPGRLVGNVTLSPAINAAGIGHQLDATLNKAASGTHGLFALFHLGVPTIIAGGAAVSEATTLYINGAPAGGVVNYSLHINSGPVLIGDKVSITGFVGLGLSTAPTKALDILGQDPSIRLKTLGGTTQSWLISNGLAVPNDGKFSIVNETTGVAKVTIIPVGDVTIATQLGIGAAPAHALQLSTDDAVKPTTNTWTIASDRRLKRKVRRFVDGLDVIRALTPVSYELTGRGGFGAKGAEGISVIAQEAEKRLSPLLKRVMVGKSRARDGKDYLTWNASALFYLLVNAVKELDVRTEALYAR